MTKIFSSKVSITYLCILIKVYEKDSEIGDLSVCCLSVLKYIIGPQNIGIGTKSGKS